MADKEKRSRWDIIIYPILTFALLIYLPLFPTVYLLWLGWDKIWLILTIGWALSWYIGLAIWNSVRKDEEKLK